MTGSKRPANDWYSPYFAPTTILIAVTVLVVSIEAGKYVGNYYIQRDKLATVAVPLANAVPQLPQTRTKATPRTSQPSAQHSTAGATGH